MSIRRNSEGLAFGSVLSHADQAKLQTWFSPSFPTGAFSYSHGLEWVVEVQEVRDSQSLQSWVHGVLRYGAGRSDAILVSALWRAVCDGDWAQACSISALAAALQPSAERRLESLTQGSAFLAAVAAGWPHPLIERFKEHCGYEAAYPAAVGVAAAAHRLPLGSVLLACLHSFTANLVSAGVRLVPLGQTDGLRVMAALEVDYLDVAHEASSTGIADLGSASFLADIASMRHETQYTRLFRS